MDAEQATTLRAKVAECDRLEAAISRAQLDLSMLQDEKVKFAPGLYVGGSWRCLQSLDADQELLAHIRDHLGRKIIKLRDDYAAL